MDDQWHGMTNLFAQLGLASEPAAIQAFIAAHRPLSARIPLHEAAFWTPAQAEFLREQIENDSDWAGIIDKLDSGLRLPASAAT